MKALGFPELKVVPMKLYPDARGYFFELYRDEWGIDKFRQDNVSFSSEGVVRGLHYQLKRPQAKFVKVLAGEIVDVVVDIRLDSPTFGQHVMLSLDGVGPALYIPKGFAHGFMAMTTAVVLYKCSDVYMPELGRGIFWNDPDLKIDWPKKGAVNVSQKDLANPLLKDAELDK